MRVTLLSSLSSSSSALFWTTCFHLIYVWFSLFTQERKKSMIPMVFVSQFLNTMSGINLSIRTQEHLEWKMNMHFNLMLPSRMFVTVIKLKTICHHFIGHSRPTSSRADESEKKEELCIQKFIKVYWIFRFLDENPISTTVFSNGHSSVGGRNAHKNNRFLGKMKLCGYLLWPRRIWSQGKRKGGNRRETINLKIGE